MVLLVSAWVFLARGWWIRTITSDEEAFLVCKHPGFLIMKILYFFCLKFKRKVHKESKYGTLKDKIPICKMQVREDK